MWRNYTNGSIRHAQVIKYLIPTIIPEIFLPLTVSIYRNNPRSAESFGARRQVNHPLFVLGRECLLHNPFYFLD